MKNRKHFLAFLIIIFTLFLAACGEEDSAQYQPDEQLMTDVEHFEYTNQDGETVCLDDLKGDYWVATFIFTNCKTVCPPMTANMSKIQSDFEEEGVDTRFISFSVDPENDDPEALKEFGEMFDADFENWDFLTGYSQSEIESFAANSFKALVAKVDGYDQVNHGTSFYIVSPEGEMINSFSGTEPEEFDQIIDYITYYQNEQ